MTARHNDMDLPSVIPGVIHVFIFMAGAVVYGTMTVSSGSPLLWALYLVLLTSAVVLSFGVLRFRVKGEPKPGWITPLASAALIDAVIFGATHATFLH